MRKKRLVSLLLCFVMLLSLVPVSAGAKEVVTYELASTVENNAQYLIVGHDDNWAVWHAFGSSTWNTKDASPTVTVSTDRTLCTVDSGMTVANYLWTATVSGQTFTLKDGSGNFITTSSTSTTARDAASCTLEAENDKSVSGKPEYNVLRVDNTTNGNNIRWSGKNGVFQFNNTDNAVNLYKKVTRTSADVASVKLMKDAADVSGTSVSLVSGARFSLSAVVEATAGDALQDVTWSVSGNYGSVDLQERQDGGVDVLACGAGTATITATALADVSKSASYEVTVTSGPDGTVYAGTPVTSAVIRAAKDDGSSINVVVAKGSTLTVQLAAVDQTMTYDIASSDSSVAAPAVTQLANVSSNISEVTTFNVSAVSEGNAAITCSSTEGKATVHVKVVQPVTSVTAPQDTVIPVGQSKELAVTVNGGEGTPATYRAVKWEVESDPDSILNGAPVVSGETTTKATVAINSGVTNGKTATIKVTALDGSDKSCTFTVTANQPIEATALSLPETATVGIGNTTKLEVTFTPSDTNVTGVKWVSSNPEYATVDENTGVIRGVAVGETVITATYAPNGVPNDAIKDTCTVEVKKQEVVYLAFTSDVHYVPSMKTDGGMNSLDRLKAWLGSVTDTLGIEKFDFMGLCGDYSKNYSTSTGSTKYWSNAAEVFRTVEGSSKNHVFTTGNHEWMSGEGNLNSVVNDTTAKLQKTGEVTGINSDLYAVYCLGADKTDSQTKTGQSMFKSTDIDALRTFLEKPENSSKPVFILSHYPYHYNEDFRTYFPVKDSRGNSFYDILNAHPNVILIFAHNHGDVGVDDFSYDQIFQNEVITVRPEASKVADQYFNFTYLAAGAMSDSELLKANSADRSGDVRGKGLVAKVYKDGDEIKVDLQYYGDEKESTPYQQVSSFNYPAVTVAETCKVTYADGTTNKVLGYNKGSSVALPDAEALGFTAQDGMKFNGWKASDGTIYNAGAAFQVTGNVTLTAQWKAKQNLNYYVKMTGTGALKEGSQLLMAAKTTANKVNTWYAAGGTLNSNALDQQGITVDTTGNVVTDAKKAVPYTYSTQNSTKTLYGNGKYLGVSSNKLTSANTLPSNKTSRTAYGWTITFSNNLAKITNASATTYSFTYANSQFSVAKNVTTLNTYLFQALQFEEIPDQTYVSGGVKLSSGTVKIKVANTDTYLTEGTSSSGDFYLSSYKSNTAVGTASVNVVFRGNYAGTVTLNFNIVPATPAPDGALTANITYGQKLSDGTVSGTMKSGTTTVRGTFAFSEPDTVPTVAQSGSSFAAVFTPTGTGATNYTTAICQVAVTVAPKTVSAVLGGTVTKEYDNTTDVPDTNDLTLTLADGSVVGQDAVSVDTTGVTYTYASANAGTGITVSAAGLALTGTDAENYTLNNVTTASARVGEITPKALTAYVAARNRAYKAGTYTVETDAVVDTGIDGQEIGLSDVTAKVADNYKAGKNTVTVTDMTYVLVGEGENKLAEGTLSGDFTKPQALGKNYTVTLQAAPITVTIYEEEEDGSNLFEAHSIVVKIGEGGEAAQQNEAVGVDFYLTPTEEELEGTLQVTVGVDGKETVMEGMESLTFDQLTQTGTNEFRFTGMVDPIMMATPINVKFIPKDGTEPTKVNSYSIVSYVEELLEKDPSNKIYGYNEMAESLVNYGFYAQRYLQRVHEELYEAAGCVEIDEKETYPDMYVDVAEVIEMINDDSRIKAQKNDKKIAGVTVRTALNLESQVDLCVYLVMEKNIWDNITSITVKAPGEASATEMKSAFELTANGRCLILENVQTKNFAEYYEIVLTNNEGTQMTVKTSVMNYVKSALKSASIADDLKKAMASMYVYYQEVMKHVEG